MKNFSGKMNNKLTIFWLDFEAHKGNRRSLSPSTMLETSRRCHEAVKCLSSWKVFALNLTLDTSQSKERCCESFAKKTKLKHHFRAAGRLENFISGWLPRKLISLQKVEYQITFRLFYVPAGEIIANLNAQREKKKEKKYKWAVLMALL